VTVVANVLCGAGAVVPADDVEPAEGAPAVVGGALSVM
jgi:hypothetical protein